MDGWGEAPAGPTNAVSLAKTPNMDSLKAAYPHTTLGASGQDVGLPPGQMGNSEVGHLNIGAGRIVYQDLTRISLAIADGSFFQNNELSAACDAAAMPGRRLHLMGLLSDGGVHGHQEHIYALVDLAKRRGVSEVWLHVFLDGRDTPPDSGLGYVEKLEGELKRIGLGRIATVSGRYFAMDRDKRWDRIKLAYDAIAHGRGDAATTALEAVRDSYDAGALDEFVRPTVIVDDLFQDGRSLIRTGDAVVFWNFRPDRARELSRAFVFPDFNDFDRGDAPVTHFVTMTEYDETFPSAIAFPHTEIKDTLAETLAAAGLKQLHAAETEKYAHVTFFFNGGVETAAAGEDRILVPSPHVATYDLKPEMSAYEVTDAVVAKIEEGSYDFIVINYANADMVGHTAIKAAVIQAVEAVDECVGRVVAAVQAAGGVTIVTADHGNADRIATDGGEPVTAHTTSRVPFILAMPNADCLRPDGILADIAPTVLDLLDLSKPAEMTGSSLIC